ncbi:MAG: protein kinase [Nannocystaceae bacterium]
MAAGIRGTAAYGPAGTRPFRFGGAVGRPASAAADADHALAIGAIVDGRYEITGLVGEGGMGRVYAATHRFLRRRVALKVLRGDAQTSAESVARFRQEALLCTRIGHPGIVEVLDCATYGEGRTSRVFMVMELLEGESLEDAMARPGPADARLEWLAAIAEALAAAHRVGVVHRDIKPANVFLVGGRAPKILDFGIAKATDQEGVQTQAGALLGTPYYLAPERALGRALDGRADLYSLGVILYELLTGDVPFVGATMMEVLGHQIRSAPLDPRQAAPERPIPASVAALTLELLAKDPQARPADGDLLAARLRRLIAAEREALAALTTGPREQVEAPIAAPESATLPPIAAGASAADGAAPADSATLQLALPDSAAATIAPADSATQRLEVGLEREASTQRLELGHADSAEPADSLALAQVPAVRRSSRGWVLAAAAVVTAALLAALALREPSSPTATAADSAQVAAEATPAEAPAPIHDAPQLTPSAERDAPAEQDATTDAPATEAITPPQPPIASPTKKRTPAHKRTKVATPPKTAVTSAPTTEPKTSDGPTIKTDIYDD